MYGKSKPDLRERGLELPKQKSIKYLQKIFLKTTRENIGIKQIWFLRMQSM